MLLTEERLGSGLVCVREGIDAVAECRKNKLNPSGIAAIPGRQDWLQYSVDVRLKVFLMFPLPFSALALHTFFERFCRQGPESIPGISEFQIWPEDDSYIDYVCCSKLYVAANSVLQQIVCCSKCFHVCLSSALRCVLQITVVANCVLQQVP